MNKVQCLSRFKANVLLRKKSQIEALKSFAEEIGKDLLCERKQNSCKKIISLLTKPRNRASLIKGMNAFMHNYRNKRKKRILERCVITYYFNKCRKVLHELRKAKLLKGYSSKSIHLLSFTTLGPLNSEPSIYPISDIIRREKSALVIQRCFRKMQFHRWLTNNKAVSDSGRVKFVENHSSSCYII